MLTIQPVGIQQQNVKNVSFRGEDYNKDSSDEYKEFANSFGELEQDVKTPKFLKPFLKTLRAVSEGFVEFFAVSWATRKSASAVGKLAKSGIGKNTTKLFGYAKKEIIEAGKYIKKWFDFVNTSLKTNVKTKPIYENIANKYSQFKESKFVKPVITFVKNRIADVKGKFEKLSEKYKTNSDKFTYENIVDKIAKTLGFGCGTTSVVANVVKPEETKSGDEY